MTPIFDTNILIDQLNRIPQAREELIHYPQPRISVMTWIEVMAGVRDPQMEREARLLLSRCMVYDIENDIREEAAMIRRKKRLRLPDAIILGTAYSKNLVLITRNTKDFDASDPSVRVPYTL